MRSRRLIFLILTFMCLGWLYFKSQTLVESLQTSETISRDPLSVPQDFDDAFTIDPELLKGIEDYTILDNDQRRWDRGFWPCLELAITLSDKEISRRAKEIDFSQIDEQTTEEQSLRNELRGSIIRIEGHYQPDTLQYVQLPENPLDRQFMRLGIVGKPQADLFRLNVPEAWLVYFLDDSMARKQDLVRVEGVFFKIMEFVSKKNDQTYYLPVLVARTPQVIKPASQITLKKSWLSPTKVKWIGLASIFSGVFILIFLANRHHKKSQFKNEVLRKIKDKQKNKK